MIFIKRKLFYTLFFMVVLTTEFFYIQIGAGVARIYHFVAILIFLMLIRYMPRLFRSPVFVTLMFFVVFNIISATLSSKPDAAIASLMSLIANIGIAIATALILVSAKYDWHSLKRLILNVTLVSIFWGLFQLAIFKLAGVSLALSPEQEPQIFLGLSPAFRTEANAFGKYLVLPFLLFLPEYIKGGRNKKLVWVYATFIVGILLAFTRSAMYGLVVAFIFVLFWYIKTGKASLFFRKWSKVVAITVIALSIFISGVISVSEYALHKVDTFFSKEEILEGGSSSFRIMAMENTLNAFLDNEKTIIVGNGWGQIYMDYGDNELQTGGGDLLSVLGYGGVLGGVTYLLFMIIAFLSAMKVARADADKEKAIFAEGVMFAIVGVFITGQMSGFMIAPEFWLLIGIAIFLSIRPRMKRQQAI